MPIRTLCSSLSTGLTLIGFYPYIRSILTGQTKPHVFSWVIWGITTTLVFFGQLAAHGGVGAWPTLVSGVLTIGIAALAYIKKRDIQISRLDWLFLGMALMALPFWAITSDPLWTVVILTLVDVLGFLPTIRKSAQAPYAEDLTIYAMLFVRNIFAIVALETYSITTVIFPAAMSVAIGVMIPIVRIQRLRFPSPPA